MVLCKASLWMTGGRFCFDGDFIHKRTACTPITGKQAVLITSYFLSLTSYFSIPARISFA